MAILKVITIVIFFFLSIAVNVGGNTDHVYIGAQNWTISAAPFVNGFRGFASIFVTASFAFGGTESIGLTAGETRNPSRNIPRTIKRTWVRIFIFYVLTVLLIGFNIPYNYPGLKTKGTATSPFTIVWARAGAKAGGSFMNTVIMTSLLSAGNHALFCGSRVLYGMAVNHQAPAIFRKTTKAGVPWTCVLAIASVSLITFGASFLPGSASEIFTWCQNLVGVSNQLAWLTIGITSWRFRRSWVAQGRSPSELKFRNPLGAFAAPFVCVSITVIILVQGWSSFAPWDVESFLSNYIELPVFVLCYLFWRLFKQVSKTPSITEVDLDSGRYVDTERDEADNAQIERRENGRWGWAWKAYSWIA
jgi:AAT family amino acid transporter